MIKQQLLIRISLIFILNFNSCNERSKIELQWDNLAIAEINKCVNESKRKKGLTLIEFANKNKTHASVVSDLNPRDTVFLIESFSGDPSFYSILIKKKSDKGYCRYTFDDGKKISKEVIDETSYEYKHLENLFSDFDNEFECEIQIDRVSLSLILIL
jgi:hypothetical protein